MRRSAGQIVLFFIALTIMMLPACSRRYKYKENAVPEPVNLSPRLQVLFAKTKLVCFGRYALEVPQEAQLVWGSASFPSSIEVTNGNIEDNKRRIANDIDKIFKENRTAEIKYNGKGPVEKSWQIRYYEDKHAKADNDIFFTTYVNKGELTFILGDATEKRENEGAPAARQFARATSLQLRDSGEVPANPGYCIEHGFMADDLYENQEIVTAGIFLPSLPDVTFSISSNKDAYGDYPPAEFEKTQRAKLSLLARIAQAKEGQGISYPSRTLLREGKRSVQHWHGEESLFRRKDGVHDFEWALVGKPRDVANPSEFGAQMYTKVENNTVGAAKAASLTDDEAVALWDKLLSGLKFRVKVPGAPRGSYFLPSDKPEAAGSQAYRRER
jgi:hypothetical protein